MNSRDKGKRGERQWRDELRAHGYRARRGQQFSGSPDSPDVICDDLAPFHFEVKVVQRLNIYDAMAQALRDSARSPSGPPREASRELSTLNSQLSTKVPIVAHKRNFGQWLVTMEAETFFRLLGGGFQPSQPSTLNSQLFSQATPACAATTNEKPESHSCVSLPARLPRSDSQLSTLNTQLTK